MTGKNLKTRFEKKKIVIGPRQVPQLDPGDYVQCTCHSVQWPQECPPIQLQAPSQSPTGATIAWRFPQADGGSPPNWLDQGRASELSCGRGTERVLDRYSLQL